MTCKESLQLYDGCTILLKDRFDEAFELDDDPHVSRNLPRYAGKTIVCEKVYEQDSWEVPWKYTKIETRSGFIYVWPNHIECIITPDEVPPDAYADPDELFAV